MPFVMQFFLAFAVCLLVVMVAGYLFVRVFRPAPTMPRRLDVLETLKLSSETSLILVRRDHLEHLLIVGPANDHVLETQRVLVDLPTNKAVVNKDPSQTALPKEVLREKLAVLADEIWRVQTSTGECPPPTGHHQMTGPGV